ncbi:uncharacterized protein LOC126424866 isoform X1 [Schistocerca serialis cubense]|uniref:uncharacterized protein LOC126424866 isoform X1 n=2 Tax=Schistocerca serialis cubense TaxID=2023355 RepID=UPI00214F379E|nr:uncharacterized protein LOC126424866 isoform X1 [Schistocerca serialis cubense]
MSQRSCSVLCENRVLHIWGQLTDGNGDMMSGAAVGNKTTGDRALQQQIQTVWKTLQDTRSNLFICDTLIRQIVKPAPAVGATASRQMPETSVQTDVRPVTSVGTQCVRGTVENEYCQTSPELCTRGVQAKDVAATVRNKYCQAVADVATSVVQTVGAGEPSCDVSAAGDEDRLPLVQRTAGCTVPHREYQRLKRKTDVLKRRLRAERARNVRLLSGDSAYRLSALRLATLALSIQETYQEMLLDLGSLLQQLAALVSDAPGPATLPPPEGVGGWYRQVRELAAAALRSIIENQTEIGRVRIEVREVPSRELSPAGNSRRDRDLTTPVTSEGLRTRTQATRRVHAHSSHDASRRESSRVSVEARQKSSASADTGDDRSTGVCGGQFPQPGIQLQTVICSSNKSTPRENPIASESSFPHRRRALNVGTATRAGRVRECSQSHQMCDSDLGPCLQARGRGDESRPDRSGDSSSDEESAVDIACCSHSCHHHTYLRTFVESQKKSRARKETEDNLSVDNSGCPENETNGVDVGTATRETLHPSRVPSVPSTNTYIGCNKTRRDSRGCSSVPIGVDAEQKCEDDYAQNKSVKNCVRSETHRRCTSNEKLYEPTDHFQRQREHTERQSGRRHESHCPSGSGGRPVTNGSAESFCSTPSLGTRELPRHLRGDVELLEKCPTSSDYTETISSSITALRTSYNSASSSSVPKTKPRSRRAVRPATSSGTDVQYVSGSPKDREISQGRGGERSESACDESATLTPWSGSLSAPQSLHLRFVEILDELKEKLLQCDE